MNISAVYVQEVFKKSCKGQTALKMNSVVGGHWKLTTTNWEPSPKLILLQLPEKLPKNSTSTIIWSLGIWSKLERWKSWISGCLMSWPRIKKLSFWSAVFSYSIRQWTISWLGCDVWWKVDFIIADVQLSGWTKKKLQSTFENHTWTKTRSWSLFGGLLPTTTAFWIPAKSLYLRSVLSKSMRCTENCNACSWPVTGQQKEPNFSPWWCLTTHCTTSFKSWMSGTRRFCLIHHIHLTSCQPTTTASSISKTICRQNASTTSRRQKMLSASPLNPEDGFLCYRNKQTFLIGKNVLIVMVPILITKNVFEPSSNDLKFTVWNHNYFFINLIAKTHIFLMYVRLLSWCFTDTNLFNHDYLME